MKKARIPALCVLLLFLLTAATQAGEAKLQAMTGSGRCGDNITWNLDAAGTLTITGTGNFYGADSEHYLPWRQFAHYIVNVTISDGIATVPDCAFQNCDYLESVTLGRNVQSIGKEAFENCSRLTDIPNAGGLKTISEASFAHCPALSDFDFAGLQTIGVAAFYDSGLVNVVMPDSVQEIGEGAFDNCVKLESISIGQGVAYLDRNVFSDCPALKTVAIPVTVTAIDEYAFNSEIDDVYYAGTAAQWGKIRGGGADSLAYQAWRIHFESAGANNAAPPMAYQITVSREGENSAEMTVNANGSGMERVSVVKLYYDENGKYIDSRWYTVVFPTNDNVFSFYRWFDDDETPAKTAKLIILDGQLRPVCQSETATFES